MSVAIEGGRIVLAGNCALEDAEDLLSALLEEPGAAVDWTACEGAHTAVIQVLLAARPPMIGPPAGATLRRSVRAFVEA